MADTTAIIQGLDSAQSETNGWNAVLRDTEMNISDVARDSDTQITITVPAAASYDISANETITVTVPATALATGTGPITATPTFTISTEDVGTLSPGIHGISSGEIYNGGGSLQQGLHTIEQGINA